MKLGRGRSLTLLVLAVAAAMGGSLWNGFAYDDLPIIVNNPFVTDLHRFFHIPGATYWTGTLWRPLTIAGYALQWAADGGRPWLFHFVSLVGYLLAGWLLVALLERLGAGRGPAVAAGVLFLLHPVHVEVVANVVGQAELWVAIALLSATLLFCGSGSQQSRHARMVGLLLAIVAATTTKEFGFVAPALLLGVFWLFPGDAATSRRRRDWLVPATALTALMFFVRSLATGSFAGETVATSLAGRGLVDRALTFLVVVPQYARLLVWPFHLREEYSPPAVQIGGPAGWQHLLGLALIAAMIWAFIGWRRRRPLAAYGLWWVVVAMAPVSNLLVPTGVVMAERILFLPSIGFAMMLAAWLTALSRQSTRPVLRAASVVLALWGSALLVRCVTRVPVWRTQDRLFTQMPLDAPRDYRAWLASGEYWSSSGRDSLAERNLRTAIALWPHDPKSNEMLGQLLRVQGRCGEAVPVFEDGLRLAPDNVTIRARLVECLLSQRRYDEARRVAALGSPSLAARVNQVERATRPDSGAPPP